MLGPSGKYSLHSAIQGDGCQMPVCFTSPAQETAVIHTQIIRFTRQAHTQGRASSNRRIACLKTANCNSHAGAPVQVHKPKDKSARWPRSWPATIHLPDDCCPGDLVEVLETLQACQPTLHVASPLLCTTSVYKACSSFPMVRLLTA